VKLRRHEHREAEGGAEGEQGAKQEQGIRLWIRSQIGRLGQLFLQRTHPRCGQVPLRLD
jgi:hypothetical protein